MYYTYMHRGEPYDCAVFSVWNSLNKETFQTKDILQGNQKWNEVKQRVLALEDYAWSSEFTQEITTHYFHKVLHVDNKKG